MVPVELLKYHPNRYVLSRPFFRPLFRLFRQSADDAGYLPASAFIRISKKLLFEYWTPELERFPIEQRPLEVTRLVSGEESTFAHVAQFRLCGRNIFDLSPTLTEFLNLTDVDEVLWDRIRLPYPSFYVWFGTKQQWQFGNGRYIADGAYISSIPGHGGIQIFVTTQERGIDYANPPSFVLYRDFYYYIALHFNEGQTTVGETLRETVGTASDFQRDFEVPNIDESGMTLAEKYGVSLAQIPREQSAQHKTVEERIADLPAFRDVLRLLINSLCYFSSPSRDVILKYPTAADERLAKSTTALEVKKQRRRLSDEGYTEINFCGESLDREYANNASGKELSAHWRRGHWRNQAIGPARSDHRLLWIRPTLVRRDKQHDSDVLGHIYYTKDS